jgi:hypothetical protein
VPTCTFRANLSCLTSCSLQRQLFYFGKVVDEQLTLKSTEDMLAMGFPARAEWSSATPAPPWVGRRFMVRKVRWLRRAVAGDLPQQSVSASGQRSVDWLLQTYAPFWLCDVTKTKKGAVVATDVLRLAAFKQSSCSVRVGQQPIVTPVRGRLQNRTRTPRIHRFYLFLAPPSLG